MYVLTFVEFDVPIDSVTETFRFTYAQEEVLFDSIPSLIGVSVSPQVVDPGVSIGVRASVSVSIHDFPYPLAGTAFESGSFFGKLRARRHSLQGLPLRVIRGEAGQSLAEMVTEHYVIESLSRSGERVSIKAKDILKLADGDRSQAPAVSTGRLLFALDDVETELTLTPIGIGDAEYPASGKLALGGNEIVSFTRSGDVFTIVRAQSNTEAQEHDEDEVAQLVLEYAGESPADLVYDLLTNYTDINSDWLPLAEWQTDINEYIARLYSAEIAEPTPVKTLLNELIEQTGLVMWWDAIAQRVRLKSLRPVTGARLIDANEMLADSFRFTEQPGKHAHAIWTYFALSNPLEKLDDTQNYRSSVVTLDPDYDPDVDGPLAIRKVYSRWIAINNRPAASRLNSLLLSRYRDPPRKFSFDLFRTSDAPALGQGLNIEHWTLQDEDGAETPASVQVTSLEFADDRYVVDAEEMIFSEVLDPDDPGTARLILIDSDSYNLNLRTLHDSFYSAPESGDEVLCIIGTGVKVGSTSVATPAFHVGSWPDGVTITLRVNGRIQGRGGNGGDAGGAALYTREAITLTNNGQIYGGGGGGGSHFYSDGPLPEVTVVGGGGGAGFDPGQPGASFRTAARGAPGTTESGGAGQSGSGAGGNPGQPGAASGSSAPGGAAGAAIDGHSFVTYDATGTIAGGQVN